MSIRPKVPAKLVSELRTDTFDCSPDLVVGQTVTGASGVCSVYSGVDAAPATVQSSVTIATPNVLAKVTGGVLGVIYQIRLDVTLSNPSAVISIPYFLAVAPDLQ